MGYIYEEIKPKIFTNRGQKVLINIVKNIQFLNWQNKKRVDVNTLIKNSYGDSWLMLACVDYLEELGEIRLVEKGEMTQFNIYSI